MKQIPQKHLTETELVLELEKAGFETVSKRAVGEWRREGFLPDFDVNGRGRGKGLGKTESVWQHPDSVIERAKWISRMRSVGIGYEDLHLNLWMLDFDVYPEDVRDSLLEPLVARIEMLEAEAQEFQKKWQLDERTDGIIEDVINDGATEAIAKMPRNPFEPLIMPQELLEAISNILLNPEYNLDDFSFAETFSVLEEYNDKIQKFDSELFEAEDLKLESSNKQIQTVIDLLNNADFIQRHFSLHQVEKAVRECTNEDLAEVQNDMRIIVKIFMIFAQTTKAVLPHISFSPEDTGATDQLLPSLFGIAELLVLADISFRRNGYSETINWARGQVLDKIETEFSETARKQIEESAPVIGQALNETFEVVERKLLQFTANSPEFQNATGN